MNTHMSFFDCKGDGKSVRYLIKITLIVFFCAAVLCAGGVKKANAVPSLGVGTDGVYVGDEFEPYQEFYASGSSTEGDEGFRIGSSGSDLHIFTNITDENIWLLGENAYSSNNLSLRSPSVGVILQGSFTAKNDKIAAYRGPFVGFNLGTVLDGVGDPNIGWDLLPSGPFQPSPYYEFTAALTYTGPLPEGSYLFAVADDFNEKFDLGKTDDKFSPKTTSAVNVPVPEPTTISLLGIGLVGLVGGAARRKFKKNNKQ